MSTGKTHTCSDSTTCTYQRLHCERHARLIRSQERKKTAVQTTNSVTIMTCESKVGHLVSRVLRAPANTLPLYAPLSENGSQHPLNISFKPASQGISFSIFSYPPLPTLVVSKGTVRCGKPATQMDAWGTVYRSTPHITYSSGQPRKGTLYPKVRTQIVYISMRDK